MTEHLVTDEEVVGWAEGSVYPDGWVNRLVATRAALIEAASVFLSVATLENPHRYENSPAERMLRARLDQCAGRTHNGRGS